ncbi:MAG: tripartite tricarboxylate transporter substrate binding protein [Betaproteobacteria bacterium]|nr:tripartite tricarboxylate transporter substrate binding protein [Betaproteobacteria bacterium]PWB62870.1 MAG: MFS transporter [Betaproteobacteria bacterium]
MQRSLARSLARTLAALALALPWTAMAQSWPARTVRIVVPFAAGGPADIYARAIAEKLSQSLGQSFVVEDKPGGGSIVGTDTVAKSAPDGYTLLMMSNTHTVNESLIPDKPFALLRDFVPVAPVNYSDLLMVVHPSVPAATVAEFVALAKAQPGRLNYASSGPGTPYHMAGELFKAMAGVDVVHVPYKGSSGARTDILGGQVQMMFDAITTMAPHVRSGKLKALGSTGRVRSTVLPEVPTVSEAGVAGYEAVIWLGVLAPAGTPKAIVERLNAEITRVTSAPEMREAWARQGATAMAMTTEEFGRYLREDIEKWARVVKLSGAKADR